MRCCGLGSLESTTQGVGQEAEEQTSEEQIRSAGSPFRSIDCLTGPKNTRTILGGGRQQWHPRRRAGEAGLPYGVQTWRPCWAAPICLPSLSCSSRAPAPSPGLSPAEPPRGMWKQSVGESLPRDGETSGAGLCNPAAGPRVTSFRFRATCPVLHGQCMPDSAPPGCGPAWAFESASLPAVPWPPGAVPPAWWVVARKTPADKWG